MNQWAFNLFAGLPKTSGPVLQLNTIGALLSVVIPPLFVFFCFKYNINIRIMALTLCTFFVGMLFLSDSGEGWLAAIAGLAFILVCWRRWLLWLFVPAGALLISVAMIFYHSIPWLRATFSIGDLKSRVTLWQNTVTLLKGKAAVLGLGLGPGMKYTSVTSVILFPLCTIPTCSYIAIPVY